MRKGHLVNFDLLGLSFGDAPHAKARSAESRSDKLSFLKEITYEQMTTYTPDQIATILRQREHLLNVLSEEYRATCRKKRPYTWNPPPGFGFPESKRPWIPDYADECQFKCCHRCRPSLEGRAYLSLDGILKDDIPPTAATGFGFHHAGARPVIDADIVKEIGYRAVPWPRARFDDGPPPLSLASSQAPSTPSSPWSSFIEEDVLEVDNYGPEPLSSGQLAEDNPYASTQLGRDAPRRAATPRSGARDLRELYHSLALVPWRTDNPPSPGPKPEAIEPRTQTPGGIQSRPARGDGVLGMSSRTRDRRIHQVKHLASQHPVNRHAWSAYGQEEMNEACLDPTYNSSKPVLACWTPLPPPTPSEDAFFQGHPTPMMEEELEEGRFHETPLAVYHGVAVFEESVELGVPDVITQE
ncbi:hypothetical protein DL766_004581 [Monosporascus sp. MC13-8B]|uniref:Uncharacterized protein n=1 Tax=Monosporascus cannonballus TaxID=155416 RepID=A0ABY0H5G9_9PEZI|nr:hypothetical protein DL762_006757 [Monosporascus cannonballus]RYO85125.1 hypothetical protein DL763_007229 [Monosporascus cannonballus]RYP31061.1 hypothetical protein DL766_004581 [Monosporascus sp. MC13-8B]